MSSRFLFEDPSPEEAELGDPSEGPSITLAEKGVCEGYEKYGYNGEDFISLDVKQMRYVPHTADAAPIADIWNKRRDRIDFVKHYFTKELPDYLRMAAPYLKTTVFPDVYLLQKNSSSPVVCLATGVNSSAVTMTWRKNGQDLHEDVDEGETVPNGDGTFQKRISLKVETEEWKENQYHCVVQHENWKTMIIKNITEDEIMHNVQTFQWISHCVYDDQKGVCEGYEKYGYNGEDFISLDVNQASYIPHTADAAPIADIWNKRRDRIGLVKHYFTKELPDYLRRAAPYLKTTVFPDVYLLQKNSSSPVVCLATGVNSSAVTMTWRKNEQDLHEDVDEGETVPNGDGTFQKRISLKVETEEWKENHYHCVVQHEKMMIIKSITEDAIKHNLKHRTRVTAIISTIVFLLLLLLLSFLRRLHRGSPKSS
ncbi:H-2 class I histocompatibility antigen, K-D alpha chain-like [Pygocentrus nattereri]|uniref:H-2 class I histocompatibility antigen, K-D alpha chain-like n=1 Tax=Pygocentrus nattereri TaxID=42514 RepID=UPI001890E019|nr:H-2 class I histocompatibility antigen, K-D alpha chain-like [Pygocentrus nattereri]